MKSDKKNLILFSKMQAFGNDYVYIDAINQKIENPEGLAKFISDRHFGVGSDGLVLICKSVLTDFKMRIFNQDGTEAEMCGNALRSVAKYVFEKHLTNKTSFKIETIGGIKNIELIVNDNKVINIKACIGSPIFDAFSIPVITDKERFIMEKVTILDKEFLLSSLSWGNPHTVVFVENLDTLDILKYGPAIERKLDLFPKRTNVTFAEIIDNKNIKIREWERGCSETLGCATGCASSVVIASTLGLTSNICQVHQIGGTIEIEYVDDILTMIGPSEFVFEGVIEWN